MAKGVPLTVLQIIDICNRLVDNGNVGHKVIARDYGVEHATISSISRTYLNRVYVWKQGANRELVKKLTQESLHNGPRIAKVLRAT